MELSKTGKITTAIGKNVLQQSNAIIDSLAAFFDAVKVDIGVQQRICCIISSYADKDVLFSSSTSSTEKQDEHTLTEAIVAGSLEIRNTIETNCITFEDYLPFAEYECEELPFVAIMQNIEDNTAAVMGAIHYQTEVATLKRSRPANLAKSGQIGQPICKKRRVVL